MADDDINLKQAARCLKLADKVTDPGLAERLRVLATEFMERHRENEHTPARATTH